MKRRGSTTASAPAEGSDSARLEDRAAREAMSTIADFVLKMDKRQANPATKIDCPAVGSKRSLGHGALGVSADGQWLICGQCEHRQGISRSEVEELEKQEQLAADAAFQASLEPGGAPEPEAATV